LDIGERLKVYIPPKGGRVEEATEEQKYDVQDKFNSFLDSPSTTCRTCVVLGRAGSGKMLFTLREFKDRVLNPWHEYCKGETERPPWLPIYFPLKNFPFAPEKAKTYVEKALLGYYQLDNIDIIRLKMGLGQHFKQRVLFILDGWVRRAGQRQQPELLSAPSPRRL
jgi:hypothetical protein